MAAEERRDSGRETRRAMKAAAAEAVTIAARAASRVSAGHGRPQHGGHETGLGIDRNGDDHGRAHFRHPPMAAYLFAELDRNIVVNGIGRQHGAHAGGDGFFARTHPWRGAVVAVLQFKAPDARGHRVQRTGPQVLRYGAEEHRSRHRAVQHALGKARFIEPFAAHFEPRRDHDVGNDNGGGGDENELRAEAARPETKAHQTVSGSTANI
ncbi:MAG: hypothetical protein J0H26_09450 [Alphaproteobacteria bacterium]|nr:hypothetical protein [Alphaproteobacteria bacterium]